MVQIRFEASARPKIRLREIIESGSSAFDDEGNQAPEEANMATKITRCHDQRQAVKRDQRGQEEDV